MNPSLSFEKYVSESFKEWLRLKDSVKRCDRIFIVSTIKNWTLIRFIWEDSEKGRSPPTNKVELNSPYVISKSPCVSVTYSTKKYEIPFVSHFYDRFHNKHKNKLSWGFAEFSVWIICGTDSQHRGYTKISITVLRSKSRDKERFHLPFFTAFSEFKVRSTSRFDRSDVKELQLDNPDVDLLKHVLNNKTRDLKDEWPMTTVYFVERVTLFGLTEVLNGL